MKQLFRGSPEQLRAGEANAPLGPVVGERSVLLLDGAEHLRHRRLMLPSFHGERMRAYEAVMREAADRAIDAWPVGEPFKLCPSMQSVTLDVIMRAVFGVEAGPRQEELKRRVRAMVDPVGTRLGILMMVLSGGRAGTSRLPAVPGAPPPGGRADLRGDRRAAAPRPTSRSREDVFSMLLLARDEDGEGADRPGAARRARDPAGRGPRDDRHRAGLGVRAAAPQPARARAAAGEPRGRRRRAISTRS